MNTARKVVTAIVTSAILGTSVLPTMTAQAQQGHRGLNAFERDDYRRDRDLRRWRDRPADSVRRRARRGSEFRGRRSRLARRDFFEDRPRRVRRAPRYVAPDYAAVRKRKRKKRLRRFIAIGAGLLGLAIIAGAASQRHR